MEVQQDLLLNRVTSSSGIVSIQVRDARGRPTQGKVFVLGVEKFAPLATDAEGRLNVKLPPSTYGLRVEGGKHLEAKAVVDVKAGTEISAEVVLGAGVVAAWVDRDRIEVKHPIEFTRKREIPGSSKKTLAEVSAILKANREFKKLEISGEKAGSVLDYLVSTGVSRSRLVAVESTLSKRVEFRIVEK